MSLAESGVDSTEAVVHGVISDANAKMVVKYLEANEKSISRIIAVRDRLVLNVTCPEDIAKSMNVVVDVLMMDQVKKCSEFQD